MKPECNVTCFTAPVHNTWCGNMLVTDCKEVQQHQGPSHFVSFFLLPFQQCFLTCLPLVVSCKATRALHLVFGCGNSVECKSLELELESMKPFAHHMLLGE